MHTRNYIVHGLILSGLCLTLFMLCAGCEDNSQPSYYNQPVNVSPLAISPSSLTLGADDTFAVLTATGGTGPYFWTVSNGTLGSLDTNSATTVVYTRIGTTAGANVVQLQDANDWMAELTIIHVASTNSSQ